MKRIIYFAVFALHMLVGLVLCAQTTPKAPQVSISNLQFTTATEVAFDINIMADCNRYVYLVSAAGLLDMAEQMGITEVELMEMFASYGIAYEECEVGNTYHHSVSDLEPNEDYGIYVLAKSPSGEGVVVQQTFTTSQTGGTGLAELSMTVSNTEGGPVHVDLTINDQTSYYWYNIWTEEDLDNQQIDIATVTTAQLYSLMDLYVNSYGASYYVHSQSLSLDLVVGADLLPHSRFVACAFPFNANNELGSYPEAVSFTTGAGSQNGFDGATMSEVNIFPNPTTTEFTVSADLPIARVRLYDLTGKMLLSETPDTNQATISTLGLASGCYVVTIDTAQGRMVKRLVVR